MHHGCFKLCPKVREQERKAFEARENRVDIESSSHERIRETAGPSGLQKIDRPLGSKRSKASSHYSSGVATPRTIKDHTPDESYESLRNPDKGRRKHGHPDKSDESLRNPDKGRRKHGHPDKSDESLRNPDKGRRKHGHPDKSDESLRNPDKGRRKHGHPDKSDESLRNPDKGIRKHGHPDKSDGSLRNPDKGRRKHGHPDKSDESLQNDGRSGPVQNGGRKYLPEIVDSSRVRRSKLVETTFGRESPSKTSGTSRKLGPERKIHRRSQASQSERQEYPSGERRDEKTVSRQPEGVRSKHSKSSAKDQLPDHNRLMTPARKDDNKAGSSRRGRGRKESMEDASDKNRDEWSRDARDNCDRNCRGIDEIVRKMRNEEQQEALDEYIINKGLSYFGDLCNCHYACLVNQLWNDSFVTSAIASAAIFALGVKLCSEMEGWTIYNTL